MVFAGQIAARPISDCLQKFRSGFGAPVGQMSQIFSALAPGYGKPYTFCQTHWGRANFQFLFGNSLAGIWVGAEQELGQQWEPHAEPLERRVVPNVRVRSCARQSGVEMCRKVGTSRDKHARAQLYQLVPAVPNEPGSKCVFHVRALIAPGRLGLISA